MADNSETSPKEVWLHHKDNPERKLLIYTLLYDQSDTCFVKAELKSKIK